MPGDFLAAGVFILSWGATYLIHSTCLLAGVWLYLCVHRRAGYTLREILWKTALVGSILSTSIQMLPGSRGTFADITVAVHKFWPPSNPATDRTSAARRAQPATDSENFAADRSQRDAVVPHVAAAAQDDVDVFWIATGNRADEPATRTGAMAAPGQGVVRAAADLRPMATRQDSRAAANGELPAAGLLVIGMAAALVAILLGVARCLWQTWLLRRKLSGYSIIDCGPARRLLDDLRRLVPHAPDVLLLSAPDDPEPAAFGVRQWTIVLPARAVCELSEDELRALLAHELAHLVRGDSTWLCISRIVCSCLAFQPLNHLARREWQRAAEYLCDSWAVSRTGTPLALARCLTEVAGWRLSGQASAALLAATGRKPGLADRIERLLEATELSETWIELHQRRRVLLAGAVLLVIAVWCAPRVQVAVAAPEITPREKPEGSPSVSREQAIAGGENVAAEGAKPPADGAGASVAAETPLAPIAEVPAERSKVKESAPATNLATLLESLDGDLSALERELHQLEPLLARESESGPVARLAERLRQEIGRLKQRRDMLRTVWKKSGD